MHIESPAGELLNLSVYQMKKQLWRCMSKTSGELLGSMEFKAPLKTQPPLQITTKISLPFFFSPRWVVAQGACFIWCSEKWSCVCSTSLQIRNVVLKRGTVRKNGQRSESPEEQALWREWCYCYGCVRLTLAELCLLHITSLPTKANLHSERFSQQNFDRIQIMRESVLLFLFNNPPSYKLSPLLLQRPYITNSLMDL